MRIVAGLLRFAQGVVLAVIDSERFEVGKLLIVVAWIPGELP